MQPKRRKLVAETADDLEHILFGDMDEADQPTGEVRPEEAQQAIVPVPRPEPEDVEVFSDSDKDSMDDFIVRDLGDDREHRFVSDYSGKYGDDVAEGLNDVIAIFGDLRILDIYSQGEFSRVKRVPEAPAALEARFDPEEVASQLSSSKDEVILSADIPERLQEEIGTERAQSLLAVFEEGSDFDSLESEWKAEAVWLYATLLSQYTQREKDDWSLWTPVKMEDEEARPPVPRKEELPFWHKYPDDRATILTLFRALLMDMKGRAMDPILIWNSMARAKYSSWLTLADLQNVQVLESDWTKLWSKRCHIEGKLMQLLAEIDGNLAASSSETAAMFGEQPEEDPDAVVSKPPASIHQVLAETAKTDVANLLAELRFACSPEGLDMNFSQTLDDISASISGEIEPIVRFISGTKGSSLIASLISHNLHETLVPLLSLSPREVGENLNIGARMNKGPFSGMVPPSVSEDPITPSLRSSVIDFLSQSVSSNVKVRRWFRAQIRKMASVFTHPTAPVSATKRLYGVRRLAGRPAKDLFGTEVFLAIQSLVNMKEVSVDIALVHEGKVVLENRTDVPDTLLEALKQPQSSDSEEDISLKNALLLKAFNEQKNGYSEDLLVADPLLTDLLVYMAPDNRQEPEWIAALRTQIARAIVGKLYKVLKAELTSDLLRDSCSVVARNSAVSFGNMLRMRAFNPRETLSKSLDRTVNECKDERVIRDCVRRKMGFFSTLSVVIEKVTNGFRTHCVVLSHRGDMVEHVAFDALLSAGLDQKLKDIDRTRLAALIERHLVALIVIGVDDRKARGALAELKSVVQEKLSWEIEAWKYLPVPQVSFSALTVPSRVAKSGLPASYADQPYPVKLAVSLGRFQQCPSAEILSLWSDVASTNNPVLAVPVHDLQAFVPKPVLEKELLITATRIVSEDGVDLNDCVVSSARRSLLKFLPGLGPRKARLLVEKADAHVRGLDGVSDQSRPERLQQILGKRVYRNCQPFLRLAPDCDKVSMHIVENGLTGRRKTRARRDRSMSSGSCSRSDGSVLDSESDSDSASSEGENDSWSYQYFGIPNSIVSSVLEGYNMFELCRFGKDCWAAADRLVSLSLDRRPESLLDILGDSDAGSKLHGLNPTDLIDEMYEADLPPHLADSAIDQMDLKTGTGHVFGSVVIPEMTRPFSGEHDQRIQWAPVSKQKMFYAMVKESPAELNKCTVTTCTVTEGGKWIKCVDTASGLEGWLTKGYSDNARYNAGDSLTCRVTNIDMMKLSLDLSTEPLDEQGMKDFVKYTQNFVYQNSDFQELVNLGKIEVVQKAVVKSRRIIKHESFFEISHGAAVEKLLELPIGDVIFRPSTSQPGVYFGLIKISNPSGDPAREDWIKIVRFAEGPSTRTKSGSKTVFKLLDFGGGDEFEEFDQMKVVYVEKYMRYLAELRGHPKFRPEQPDQVRNMLLAKMKMGNQSSVAYAIVMDNRRECAGNALLLWAGDKTKVHEDVIEITHRGFRWWSKGPYPSVNALLNWWKQGGHRERPKRVQEWQEEQNKKASF